MTKPVTEIPPELAKALPLSQTGGIDWWQLLENWGAAVAILLIGMWLAKRASRFLFKVNERARMDAMLNGFLCNIAYAFLLVIVFIATLDKIGVPITSALAILGTAGLAIGLSLKDSLSNIASGVMLIMLRPFSNGDTVLVSGQEGVVEEIRIFQTCLRTFDNRVITLPNRTITAAHVINYTRKPQRRIDINLNFNLDADIERIRKELLDLAMASENILNEPAPTVLVSGVTDANSTITISAWTDTSNFGDSKCELNRAVFAYLAAEKAKVVAAKTIIHVYHYDAEGKPIEKLNLDAIVSPQA